MDPAIEAARENIKNYCDTCCEEQPCDVEVHVIARKCLELARELELERNGGQGAIAAYHATLDSLNAPADKWPCNRVKSLVDKLQAEVERLKTDFKEACSQGDYWEDRFDKADALAKELTTKVNKWERTSSNSQVELMIQVERAEKAETQVAVLRRALEEVVSKCEQDACGMNGYECERCGPAWAALASTRVENGERILEKHQPHTGESCHHPRCDSTRVET